MSQDKLTLTAVGDVIVDHEKSGREAPEAIFALSAPVLRSGDIVFGQCEALYSERGHPAGAQHPALACHPRNMAALKYAGFNVMSVAGNHTLDMGWDALEDTLNYLKQNGIASMGGGRNIEEARKPLIVERQGIRVAFLAHNCVGPVEQYAGVNKPGCSGIKVWTVYQPAEYQPGTPPQVLTFADREDLAAMKESISRAKAQADIVILSSHQGWHHIPALLPIYQQEINYAAIDAGADLVLGHHAHILKGIEVYKGKVIFYGLGNFAVDYSTRAYFSHDWGKLEYLLYPFEPDPAFPDYPWNPEQRKTMIVKAIISDKKIEQVSFFPVLCNKERQPEVLRGHDPRSQEIAKYVERISKEAGLSVRFSWQDDEVVISPGDQPTRMLGPQVCRFATAVRP